MFGQLSLQALKKNDGLNTKQNTKHSKYWNLHYDTTLTENCWTNWRGLICPGPGDCRDLDLPFLYF